MRGPCVCVPLGNPNPAWGGKLPGPEERVVGRQIVAPDSAPPPGEMILGAAGALAFDREFAPAPTADAIGVEFFAARHALADRRIK